MSTRICSVCRVLLPSEAFYSATHYGCRACDLKRARERYRQRNGLSRAWRMRIPDDFSEHAGKEWDVDLAERYGVSYKTISRWRRKLGIPPKERAPHMAAWGQLGMRVARETRPDLMTGFARTRKANAAREAREKAADATGITRPTIRTPHLGDDRRLLQIAMQAFGRPAA